MFLYIVPLKQGLKLSPDNTLQAQYEVFIHSSIKTRIETQYFRCMGEIGIMFLYIDPLKQGLKP